METAQAVRSPERLTVSEASEKYIVLNNPGSFSGYWKNSMAPYLVEVMDSLTSYDLTGVVMVAPAQCGKTQICVNWMGYSIICDPLNFMLVEKTQTTARDFSRMRFDSFIQQCPELRKRLARKQDDNVHDKKFSSGCTVLLSWPTKNNLAGKSIPRLALTDYDRMSQDIDGEGNPFDLANARMTTFGHFGMVMAESSPSFPIQDPRWSASTSHEGPPCEGIVSLYNRGDRRLYYWLCVDCGQAFEPDFRLLRWPETENILEAAEQVYMPCPHCGSIYHHEPQGAKPGKHGMNRDGLWIRDNMRYVKGEGLVGTPIRSKIASFWLKGPAAAFKTWTDMTFKYLTANATWERTGAEEDLRTTINVDQGLAYLPKSLETERVPERIMARAIHMGTRTVPTPVRFLVAAVDVQKNRFVAQVHGIADGNDIYVIDRFNVRFSLDPHEDRPDQQRIVRPHSEAKDWRLLLREVMLKSYEIDDGTGREMAIKCVVCDSGGLDGTTANAYAFWRWLRNGPNPRDDDYAEWEHEWTPGMGARLALYKGDVRTDSRARVTYPDSGKKSDAGAGGEIPVLACNANLLKDQLDGLLDRDSQGTGRIYFPKWLDLDFYKELTAEVRNPQNYKWENPKKFRNESWDLLVMTLAILIEQKYVGSEGMDWANPPDWADVWDRNPLVTKKKGDKNPIISNQRTVDRKGLAKLLA